MRRLARSLWVQVLAAALLGAAVGNIPVAGLTLLIGVDRFMSEARAITNLIGNGVAAVVVSKWEKELDYRLIKDLWAFDGNHIAVRFQYEWHDAAGRWYRSYGNEQWEFDEHGLMRRREASINDFEIAEKDRRFHWAAPGPRPADVPGLGESPF